MQKSFRIVRCEQASFILASNEKFRVNGELCAFTVQFIAFNLINKRLHLALWEL